jgi:hypothetical protein
MASVVRHKTNPFLENMVIPIGGKSVKISALGKDDNILVNQHTGEVTGTHVVARKRVDKEKFVKTFADYMAFTFDLTAAGNKTLRLVMWAVQEQAQNSDVVTLDKYTRQDFLKIPEFENLNFSEKTYLRGLSELVRAQIIAKTIRSGRYFINPNCMFNGDRVAFSTVIEKESEEQMGLNYDTD